MVIVRDICAVFVRVLQQKNIIACHRRGINVNLFIKKRNFGMFSFEKLQFSNVVFVILFLCISISFDVFSTSIIIIAQMT